ncbi:MAG: hypothetical protein IJC43_09200 [Clostridia bacterium]|nr:hypothetical protein [Clostridia bacterium]
MAQRDLNRRFSEALLGLRNGLTVSLPLAGPFGERLFFYQAVRSPEGTLQLVGVESVATRRADGQMTVQPASELLSAEELSRFRDVPLPQGPTGAEALEAVRLYYEAYDKALPLLLAGGEGPFTEEARRTLRSLPAALGRIVPAGPLRELYKKLGAESFRFISKAAGGRREV